VSGFKSFADKLEIKFGSGITGIVGPNGCGKSNVADAVRWVLGEQSAKLLRGSSMQDVIFSGTEKRKSLSFCEVSLIFNNAEDELGVRLFPALDYKEVVISRKLYRSGESEYLLNKQTCRLKDITELLRDGGMGREGYSIIGQGRIDELLSAKPEDRRAIFEEAAGISKFKAKKIESERKLLRTDDNLSRISDILDEKAKQLEPLTRQSEAARKWLSYRDRLRHHEINLYIHQYDTATEAKTVIKNRLDGVLEELDLRNRESEKASDEYNEAMQSLANTDRTIESLREELLALTESAALEAGEIKVLNERLGWFTAEGQRLSEDNRKADLEHAATVRLVEEGEEALALRRAELSVTRAEVDKLTEEFRAVAEQLSRGQGDADKRHVEVVAAMGKLGEIKANMGRLLAEKESLVSLVADLQKRAAFLDDRLSADGVQAGHVKKEIDAIASEKESLLAHRAAATGSHNEALAVVGECAGKLDGLSAQFHAVSTRLKMFTEMRDLNESFGFALKKLVTDAKANKELSSRIESIVAHLVKVKPGFEAAIETALGASAQNIVTKSEEEAKYLIAYLKEKRYGQITFLPMTSVKPRRLEPGFLPLLSGEGCMGTALDCITFEPRYEAVMRSLLGSTVVARDMDAAVTLAKKSGYGFKIVTLEGDVIQTSGSITGGSKKSELTNIFGYDREIDTLTRKLAAIDKEMKEQNALRDQKAAEKDAASAKMSELGERIHAIDIDAASKREVYASLEAMCESGSAGLASLNAEIENASGRIQSIDADINSVAELETLIAGERAMSDEAGKEERQKYELLRAARDELNDKLVSGKTTIAVLEADIRNFESDIRRFKESALGIAERIENNHRQLSENTAAAAGIDRELSAFSIESREGDTERIKEIRGTLCSMDEFKQGIACKLSETESRRKSLVEEIQAVHEKKSKEEMLLLKVDTDIEYMQGRVWEEYELTYDACLPFKEEAYDITEGSAEAAKLKRQMSSLGHVNLEAIDMAKQVYESYHELSLQRDDLFKAKTDLERIIADLETEMLQRFTVHFEAIRRNFARVFRELFDGGTADLLLVDSENPLEAGVEIVAQPPEKKLQSILLLSGGERALTAIAILFSILKLKPMPFCVLDEIEAALDDANATRFAKYLRRFSEETQFIVITHRKPTMELADTLYGVTMEEKGVSKIVSVKLADAVAAAEPA